MKRIALIFLLMALNIMVTPMLAKADDLILLPQPNPSKTDNGKKRIPQRPITVILTPEQIEVTDFNGNEVLMFVFESEYGAVLDVSVSTAAPAANLWLPSGHYAITATGDGGTIYTGNASF